MWMTVDADDDKIFEALTSTLLPCQLTRQKLFTLVDPKKIRPATHKVQ